jgi:hypothetical protein
MDICFSLYNKCLIENKRQKINEHCNTYPLFISVLITATLRKLPQCLKSITSKTVRQRSAASYDWPAAQ